MRYSILKYILIFLSITIAFLNLMHIAISPDISYDNISLRYIIALLEPFLAFGIIFTSILIFKRNYQFKAHNIEAISQIYSALDRPVIICYRRGRNYHVAQWSKELHALTGGRSILKKHQLFTSLPIWTEESKLSTITSIMHGALENPVHIDTKACLHFNIETVRLRIAKVTINDEEYVIITIYPEYDDTNIDGNIDNPDEFVSLVVHDLKSPVKNINAITELLQEDIKEFVSDCKDPGQCPVRCNRFGLEMIDKEVVHIRKIAGSMLDMVQNLNKYGATAIDQNHRCPTDLNDIFDDIIAEASGRIPKKMAFFKADMPTLLVDPIKMKQLFGNIIENAIKFRKPKEILEINVLYAESDASDAIAITISDNGQGFDEKHASRIFLPLKKLNKNVEGSGIGLSICKKIVSLYNGTIYATGELGKGAEFTILLPSNLVIRKNKAVKWAIFNK